MQFHTAEYDVYVTLGDSQATPLWNWNVWQRFLPAIDPLVEVARGKPSVRSTQYLPNRAGTVKFGRLGWKDSDHQKWTHGSPSNDEESKSWTFLSVEAWAPAWTTCSREDRAPDVFLSVVNESVFGGRNQELLFNPVVILAVVAELSQRESAIVSDALSAMRELMLPRLLGYRRRPWGLATGPASFTNAIQDLAASGLFKPGPRHKETVGFHLLTEEWTPIL